ncbi:hypothetical protein JTB14_030921 [Gonioctena quinquepunctata]|nr:hypothetical protein JTB14_030921 [Gonioctena quinquepunctata]
MLQLMKSLKLFGEGAKTYYTNHMEIYAGAQLDGPYSISNKSTDVVKRMISSISNTGRNVTMDNIIGRSISNTGLPHNISNRLKEIVSTEENVQQPDNQNSDLKRKLCVPCQREKRTRLTKFQCSSYGKHLCLQNSNMICSDDCGEPTKRRRLEDPDTDLQFAMSKYTG